jgi:hypothetical protein
MCVAAACHPDNMLTLVSTQNDITEAYNLLKDVEPTTPQEYILKGIVNAVLGQEHDSQEHIKIAQQYFQVRVCIGPSLSRPLLLSLSATFDLLCLKPLCHLFVAF